MLKVIDLIYFELEMKIKYLNLNSLSKFDFHVRKDIILSSEEEVKFFIILTIEYQSVLFKISIYSFLSLNNYTYST